MSEYIYVNSLLIVLIQRERNAAISDAKARLHVRRCYLKSCRIPLLLAFFILNESRIEAAVFGTTLFLLNLKSVSDPCFFYESLGQFLFLLAVIFSKFLYGIKKDVPKH